MIRRARGRFARTPRPPYYAVIFTSLRSRADAGGYARAAERIMRLAGAQPGFLGAESVRGGDGLGITVSYWRSAAAIRRWHRLAAHRAAQAQGYARWYDAFELRVARVTRAYAFFRGDMNRRAIPG